MKHAAERSIKIALLFLLISAAFGSAAALAQSGSAGGSIGNDEKSLSGSREAPRSVESSKPARRGTSETDEPRRASRSSGGGGGNNFDGAWIVTGVGVTCSGTSSNAVVVTSARSLVRPPGAPSVPAGKYTGPPAATA